MFLRLLGVCGVSGTACEKVIISNKLGLHARPAMMFVDTASKYQSGITVCRSDNEAEKVDGKSIMQMMMLAATQGTELTITAEGDDACEAVGALIQLINSRFEEE